MNRCVKIVTRSSKYQGWKDAIWFLIVLICLLFLPFNIVMSVETAKRQAEAYRTSMTIKVDGVLDEADWEKAKPITSFTQIQPDEGEPASQPMEVRILYDDKNIYFGYKCYDSDMSKVVMNEMRRDSHGLYDNDHGFLILDTYNARRNAVFFRFNAIGGVEDVAVSNCGDSRNESWDIVWKCRGSINEDHWVVELGIPFSQLRFKKSDTMTWGMNLGRNIARRDEISTWGPAPKSYGPMAKYRMAYFGSLVGLEGIKPSRHLELLPYVTAGASRIEGENDAVYDAGLDVKYGITSNLTADLTFNTDFAQVEADEEQVNLTRFDLFFPEKRPFFMEGASLFDFGVPRPSFHRPPPMLLFYSRRIGLAENRVVPILAGAKVTGKIENRAGCYGVGLLNVLTDEFYDDDVEEDMEPIDEPYTNYTVLRLKRDIFSGSSLGIMAVNKQSSDSYNRSAGLDFAFRPSNNLDISGVVARTFEEDVSEKSNAFYLGSNWRNDHFRADASYIDIGEFFNPAVGFIYRGDIRQFSAGAGYEHWPQKFGIKKFELNPDFDIVLNHDNELITQEISFGTDFDLEMDGFLGFHIGHTKDLLDEDFEIREGIIIPADEYEFTDMSVFFGMDAGGMFSSRIFGDFGQFFNGDKRGIGIHAGLKPNARFSIDGSFDFNRVILSDESFNASIFSSRISYAFSTNMFAKIFGQWSSLDEIFSTNLLINYIYRPGSDFYLVVNQIYGTDDGFSHQETTVIGKVTFWWNP